jgi:hypothetical protein
MMQGQTTGIFPQGCSTCARKDIDQAGLLGYHATQCEERSLPMFPHSFGRRPQDIPDFPPDDPFAAEWKTYKREVARLLAEGHQGRFALVKGDDVVSTWDTWRDACQAGDEKFGHGSFMVHEIQEFERPIRTPISITRHATPHVPDSTGRSAAGSCRRDECPGDARSPSDQPAAAEPSSAPGCH